MTEREIIRTLRDAAASATQEVQITGVPFTELQWVADNHKLVIKKLDIPDWYCVYPNFVAVDCPHCKGRIGRFNSWDDHGTFEVECHCGKTVLLHGQALSSPLGTWHGDDLVIVGSPASTSQE